MVDGVAMGSSLGRAVAGVYSTVVGEFGLEIGYWISKLLTLAL